MTRRASGRATAAVVAGLMACAAIITLTASPAAATTAPVVLVSTDGVDYQPSLAVGLFDGAGLLVPGASATSDLWIKNPLSTPATIRVNVANLTSSSPEFSENMELTALDVFNGSSITETWGQLAACDVMVQPVTIAGGAVIRIHLALAMLDANGKAAQLKDGSMTANVQMRDAAGGSFPASTCDAAVTNPGHTQPAITHPRKVLGYTGETFPTPLLILGGVLVGVGWFLIVARRRRKREETQQ